MIQLLKLNAICWNRRARTKFSLSFFVLEMWSEERSPPAWSLLTVIITSPWLEWETTDLSHSLPARAADTPVILTNSPICAAIPSLPHTRLILPPAERKILLRHNAMSLGQHNTKLLLWDLSSLIWRVPAKMFPDCVHMKGFLIQAHEQEQCSIFHEMLFGWPCTMLKGGQHTTFKSQNCKTCWGRNTEMERI